MENRDLTISSFTCLISHRDVLLEILTKLDVKSLFLLKLVCKDSNTFLSHSSFSLLYSQKKPPLTAFFYQTSKDYPEKLQFIPIGSNEEPISDPPSCLGFLDSPVFLFNLCNGLLHWSSTEQNKTQKHFISNPLTQKFVEIQWPIDRTRVFASGIVFDPALSDQFQVVVLAVESRRSLKLMVFSSETMRWVEGEETLTLTLGFDTWISFPFCPNRGVFLKGFLYWELQCNALIAYNVEEQVVDLMKLPLMNELIMKLGFRDPGCLGESGGKLHYCRVMGTVLSVWVKNQRSDSDGVDWVHQHLVNLSSVMCGRPSIITPCGSQALAFLDGCEAVLVGVEGKVIAFRFNGGAVREVCKVRRNGFDSGYLRPSEFFPFVHSLALSNFPSKAIDELPS